MSGFIEHLSTIIRPNTCINTGMHYQEGNEKQTTQSHYEFLAN
jgi:hypothetical protein